MTSNIESVVTENRIFPPSEAVMKSATISGRAAYDALCAEADRDYSGYWARLAREHLSWKQPFTVSLDESKAARWSVVLIHRRDGWAASVN